MSHGLFYYLRKIVRKKRLTKSRGVWRLPHLHFYQQDKAAGDQLDKYLRHPKSGERENLIIIGPASIEKSVIIYTTPFGKVGKNYSD